MRDFQCVECGTPFVRPACAPNKIYCSRRCNSRVANRRGRRPVSIAPRVLNGHTRRPEENTGPQCVCSCGEASGPLPSRVARARWHQQHKADVLAARSVEDVRDELMRVRLATEGVVDNGCLRWTGPKNEHGYGLIAAKVGGIHFREYAHRANYRLNVGPVPDGLQLDHLCRVRDCYALAHLEPVTPAENVRRATPSALGFCKRGHPLTDPDALYVSPSGRRMCRACIRLRQEARRVAYSV